MNVLPFFTFLFGASLGSFLAAWIVRSKAGEDMSGRSHCRSCGKELRNRDNIPILSWILLRGQSFCCGKRISPIYPIIETLSALAGLLLGLLLINA